MGARNCAARLLGFDLLRVLTFCCADARCDGMEPDGDQRGEITIEARKTSVEGAEHIDLRVIDTGIGIATSALTHVFDLYRQADASIHRRFGGTGLGLPLCRRLAQAMEACRPRIGSCLNFSAAWSRWCATTGRLRLPNSGQRYALTCKAR